MYDRLPDRLTTWQTDRPTSWRTDSLTNGQINKLTALQTPRLTDWESDRLTDWLSSDWNMTKTCVKHDQHMSETWPKHVWNMTKACMKHVGYNLNNVRKGQLETSLVVEAQRDGNQATGGQLETSLVVEAPRRRRKLTGGRLETLFRTAPAQCGKMPRQLHPNYIPTTSQLQPNHTSQLHPN